MSKGYVINSFICVRDGDDDIFRNGGDGVCVAYLDGYAVVPLEHYEELTATVREASVGRAKAPVVHVISGDKVQ